MANDPKNPQVGELHIDASELAPNIVDLPPGAAKGMRSKQDGFEEVVQEIFANQAQWGDKAGVTAADLAAYQSDDELIAHVDRFLPAIAKAHELLLETRYNAEDRRQRRTFNIAESVDRRSKDHPELTAKYEKTRAYRSASAKKGLKTRMKNAEQEGGPVGDGGPSGGGGGDAPK